MNKSELTIAVRKIKKCIRSCITEQQLDSGNQMIDNLNLFLVSEDRKFLFELYAATAYLRGYLNYHKQLLCPSTKNQE